ncbi:MAG TPA: hypothetical protein VG965_01280 [Patescibacteria group bacterium]|nr:hypothetical protein [Patescibacteria group bacterium]
MTTESGIPQDLNGYDSDRFSNIPDPGMKRFVTDLSRGLKADKYMTKTTLIYFLTRNTFSAQRLTHKKMDQLIGDLVEYNIIPTIITPGVERARTFFARDTALAIGAIAHDLQDNGFSFGNSDKNAYIAATMQRLGNNVVGEQIRLPDRFGGSRKITSDSVFDFDMDALNYSSFTSASADSEDDYDDADIENSEKKPITRVNPKDYVNDVSQDFVDAAMKWDKNRLNQELATFSGKRFEYVSGSRPPLAITYILVTIAELKRGTYGNIEASFNSMRYSELGAAAEISLDYLEKFPKIKNLGRLFEALKKRVNRLVDEKEAAAKATRRAEPNTTSQILEKLS